MYAYNIYVHVYMRIQVADTKAVGLAPGGEDDGDDDLGAAAAGTHTCTDNINLLYVYAYMLYSLRHQILDYYITLILHYTLLYYIQAPRSSTLSAAM